jgi:hypothetical protein
MLIHDHNTLALLALYITFGARDNHFALGLSRKYTRRWARNVSREEALKLLVL